MGIIVNLRSTACLRYGYSVPPIGCKLHKIAQIESAAVWRRRVVALLAINFNKAAKRHFTAVAQSVQNLLVTARI